VGFPRHGFGYDVGVGLVQRYTDRKKKTEICKSTGLRKQKHRFYQEKKQAKKKQVGGLATGSRDGPVGEERIKGYSLCDPHSIKQMEMGKRMEEGGGGGQKMEGAVTP